MALAKPWPLNFLTAPSPLSAISLKKISKQWLPTSGDWAQSLFRRFTGHLRMISTRLEDSPTGYKTVNTSSAPIVDVRWSIWPKFNGQRLPTTRRERCTSNSVRIAKSPPWSINRPEVRTRNCAVGLSVCLLLVGFGSLPNDGRLGSTINSTAQFFCNGVHMQHSAQFLFHFVIVWVGLQLWSPHSWQALFLCIFAKNVTASSSQYKSKTKNKSAIIQVPSLATLLVSF